MELTGTLFYDICNTIINNFLIKGVWTPISVLGREISVGTVPAIGEKGSDS
jgi:hypothetical protein